MTVDTTLTPPTVADVLRGDRSRRPLSDHAVAAGLRADLEDRLFELFHSTTAPDPVRVGPRDVRDDPRVAELSHAPSGRLRGVLVGEILRLLSVGYVSDDPFRDALAAWRSQYPTGDLAAFADQLDADDRARLATDVTAHAVTLSQRLGGLNPRWRPRTNVSSVARLAGGRVEVRDIVDLVVGSVTTMRASITLFDVTTSPLNEGHERVQRFHALCETLRSHVAPLRVVTLSTATGDIWSMDVETELLRRALDELVGAIERRVRVS